MKIKLKEDYNEFELFLGWLAVMFGCFLFIGTLLCSLGIPKGIPHNTWLPILFIGFIVSIFPIHIFLVDCYEVSEIKNETK